MIDKIQLYTRVSNIILKYWNYSENDNLLLYKAIDKMHLYVNNI